MHPGVVCGELGRTIWASRSFRFLVWGIWETSSPDACTGSRQSAVNVPVRWAWAPGAAIVGELPMAGQGCSVVVVSWPEVTVEGRLRTRHDTKPRAGALTVKQLVNDKRVRAPLPPSIPPSLPPPPWPRINGFVTGICPETLQLPSTLHLTLLAAVGTPAPRLPPAGLHPAWAPQRDRPASCSVTSVPKTAALRQTACGCSSPWPSLFRSRIVGEHARRVPALFSLALLPRPLSLAPHLGYI